MSDKVLFSFPGDPKGTAKRGDGGEQERWRMGIGTQSFGQHKLKRSLTYLLYDARRTFHTPWLFKVLYIKGSEIDIKQL